MAPRGKPRKKAAPAPRTQANNASNRKSSAPETQRNGAGTIPRLRNGTDLNAVSSRKIITVPQDLQQRCLNIFCDTLRPSSSAAHLLQEVKGHLYNRDFATAFSSPEYLRVYASRWSSSRALAYTQIFIDIQDELLQGLDPTTQPAAGNDESEGIEFTSPVEDLKIACLGGGAGAELVALAAWHSTMHQKHAACDDDDSPSPILAPKKISARFVDIAEWDTIVAELYRSVVTPPTISKYASAAAREANHALLPEDAFASKFLQADALNMGTIGIRDNFADTHLVTLMFTLNELYCSSVNKTQQFLTDLTAVLQPGAQLLVVDSPGSYSSVTINNTDRKYPMHWLLDHVLLPQTLPNLKEQPSRIYWQKICSDESRWFRLPPDLQYPIELENMRYQIHLYRRINSSYSES